MRHQMKVTTRGGQLHIRTGPGMNYKIVGYLNNGSSIIVNELKTVNKWKWYKHESGRGWSCAYRADWKATYLKFVKDLDPPKPKPKPVPPPPPPKDYSNIEKLLNDKANIKDSNVDFSSFTVTAGKGHTSSEGLKDPPIEARSSGPVSPRVIIDSTTKENLDRIRKNLNIINGSTHSTITSALFNTVDRLKVAKPDYHLTKTFSHVFFTRPDLYLLNSDCTLAPLVKNDPLYYYLYKNDSNILKCLSKYQTSSHDLNLFLSNTAQSFEVADEFVKTTEHGETFTGYKVQYGLSNIESRTAGTFNIKYVDDKNYTIYKIHKAWVEYISKVYRGELSPRSEYRYKKILDYACSVYYIVCGEDGETILFWTKYFGVFPTNVPSSTSSWSAGSLLKIPEYNITYAYAFKEDFTPLTLAELNINTKSKGTIAYRKIYEPEQLGTGKTFVNAPFIETKIYNNEYVFRLKFKH